MRRTINGRAHRPRWALPLTITGGALVALVAAITITNAVTATPHTAAPPTPSPTSGTDTAATGSGSGSTSGDEQFAAIRGCLAGPDITAVQLTDIRAEKHLDPAGAAEFLGAWMQFAGAASPERRDGWWDVLNTMTSGTARSTYAAAGNDISAYGDDKVRSIDLSHSAIRLVDYDSKHVVLDISAAVLTDGQLVRTSERLAPAYEGVGGRYTLSSTRDGWRISALDLDAPWAEAAAQGVAFTEGC